MLGCLGLFACGGTTPADDKTTEASETSPTSTSEGPGETSGDETGSGESGETGDTEPPENLFFSD